MLDLHLLVERGLGLAHAVEMAVTLAGEDVRVAVDARLSFDDVDRDLRQSQLAAYALLTLFIRDRPDAVDDGVPAHGQDLLAPLCGEQRETQECAERAVGLGLLPDETDLVVVEDAGARRVLRSPHPRHDGTDVAAAA